MYPVFHITYHNYNCETCLNSSLVRIKSGFMVKSSHIFFNLMSIIAFSFKHLHIFTAHNTIFLHTRTTCEMKCFITILIWINITLLTNFLQREIVPELWSSFCIAKLFKKIPWNLCLIKVRFDLYCSCLPFSIKTLPSVLRISLRTIDVWRPGIFPISLPLPPILSDNVQIINTPPSSTSDIWPQLPPPLMHSDKLTTWIRLSWCDH